MWNNKFITKAYSSRVERYHYISLLISNYFPEVKKILNIGGGGQRHVSKFLNEKKKIIFEVDINGDNDLNTNLDKINKLPFDKNQFDTIICLDVLEHSENYHKILNDFIRVTSKYIFISLPNCSNLFFDIIFNKKRGNKSEGFYFKYYGLPIDYTKDRHRWFCTIQDYETFFADFALKNNLKIDLISHKIKKFSYKFLTFFFW